MHTVNGSNNVDKSLLLVGLFISPSAGLKTFDEIVYKARVSLPVDKFPKKLLNYFLELLKRSEYYPYT